MSLKLNLNSFFVYAATISILGIWLLTMMGCSPYAHISKKLTTIFVRKISVSNEDNLFEENDSTIKFTRCYEEKAIEISYEETQSDKNKKS